MDPLQNLQTEAINPMTARLDELTSLELVDLVLQEDSAVVPAVRQQRIQIAQAIDAIATRLANGGRLIYLGAGTSGRLGVLDASECPPTFQTPHEQIIGLIAGGPGAMFKAVEGAEDSQELGEQDLANLGVSAKDVVCGIASSGRTPYVLGGLKYAREQGAFTLGVVCNFQSDIEQLAELTISAVVGPEILSGSTRLKAGTATKLILNLLTTGSMVRLGKTYGNLMVDLKASNEKLKLRANRIVRTIANLSETEAHELLVAANQEVKTAIVMSLGNLDATQAREQLVQAGGRIKQALGMIGQQATSRLSSSARAKPKRLDLVLGIDGGGTNTIAMLAKKASGEVLGRGIAGPSNIQAVGVPTALQALDQAIERAFAAAGLPLASVATVALGLAGVDRQEGHDVIQGWIERSIVAERAIISNDATLLLAAGTPNGWGLAVIAGTGSIAFVKDPSGQVGRAGGWGHLLGDEGSAYRLAVSGLRACCRAADTVTHATRMLPEFLKRMNLSAASDLIPAVYRGPWDRTALASMAPIVLDAAAAGDPIATEILEHETLELARTAAAAVEAHALPKIVPTALAGGVLLGSALFRDKFLNKLREHGITPEPIQQVSEPARGAVVLACHANN